MNTFILFRALSLSVLLASSQTALAGCLVDDFIPQKAQVLQVEACRTTVPLALSQSHNTEYWLGTVSRTILVKVSDEHIVTNRCSHEAEKRTIESSTEIRQVDFNVRNPNLKTTSTHSYDLLPMTDTEAQVEMNRVMQECQSWKP